jgi:amino acid transporter
MALAEHHHIEGNPHGGLRRTVGFYGLMFVSLGSIIGSGWLLSALNATEVAGPAAILAWVLAAVMLTVLALCYAELGAVYPVAGGSGRYPYYSHGPLTGFVAGWTSWLQAVAIAPIEVLAAITYINSIGWVDDHFQMLHGSGDKAGLLNSRGLIVATLGMILFTAMNLAGASFMAESNAIVVIWKTLVPILAILVVVSLSFHTSNFHAGGGFAPFGLHGILAALPAGVIFALQGFEQAVQLAGEARNPKRDISRAIITAMGIGAVLYVALQGAFIAALDPTNVSHDWSNPLGENPSDYGAWYTLALAVGAGWLATILIIDAVVSPSGTGVVYVGTTSRLSYALGEEKEMPSALSKTNAKGVPVVSILVAAVVGEACFGPFPSWSKLVPIVTGATAIMYAFAPVSLAALKLRDGDRPRPYRMPYPEILLPAAFIFSNLLIYWGGWEYTWKLDVAILVGLILFSIGVAVKRTDSFSMLRSAVWMGPWLIGLSILSLLGNFGADGDGHKAKLPDDWDIAIVAAYSLVIFYWAVSSALSSTDVKDAIEIDADEIDYEQAQTE